MMFEDDENSISKVKKRRASFSSLFQFQIKLGAKHFRADSEIKTKICNALLYKKVRRTLSRQHRERSERESIERGQRGQSYLKTFSFK